ncbi:NAD(P)-dependent dehydrogenase (short-subunit alcohol dehydrogenase family) [Sphingobium fontiphilum]|uniref:NAD(P)-dependent dehydrogenase (Short-subunit alcohol dehydrogenase family) n=1 Tax=Sphingobium fontiphilum TaxID=944425 RepID=A0A7W6DFG4_9SPHN|nr:glucose 1-dehydrogenase [Sphingobium fontiphilum]MBB3982311.1 NAD(P)-dependent dehydrogenase (short-subunit alcohol dehydrogenase family) [Sphingobium fontiphilum]
MAKELDGKATLITGAAAGIGKAAAELFAREGARLMLSDVNGDGVEAVAADLRSQGFEAQAMATDVTSEADVAALVAATVKAYGRLDCAFNNAGIGHTPLSLLDVDAAMFNRYLAVNLTGVLWCMQHEIRQMLQQGGGTIVNTASLAGLAATPRMIPYTASKFGLIGITRSAASEFASKSIRINAVCPTSTDTEGMRDFIADQGIAPDRMFGPMGRMGTPLEIAEAALWLLSDRASFITGQALVASGGSSGQTA